MRLVLALAYLAAGGLLTTKAITGADWAQILAGQAENAQKNNQAKVGAKNAEGTVTGTTPSSGSLPVITSKGGGSLNSNQLSFANTLAKLTGLNIAVVKGWVLGEEPPSSSQAPNGANNWLNIGSTDSGFYGASNPAWSDPVSAAHQTAKWLAGGHTVGYGTASSGIQGILASAGSSIAAQIAAIQNSGWASGGYPSLPNLASEFR